MSNYETSPENSDLFTFVYVFLFSFHIFFFFYFHLMYLFFMYIDFNLLTMSLSLNCEPGLKGKACKVKQRLSEGMEEELWDIF